MAIKNTIRFETRYYVYNHGAEPRGFGLWAFDFGAGAVFAPEAMSFGAAKKWALKHARTLPVTTGFLDVTVCS